MEILCPVFQCDESITMKHGFLINMCQSLGFIYQYLQTEAIVYPSDVNKTRTLYYSKHSKIISSIGWTQMCSGVVPLLFADWINMTELFYFTTDLLSQVNMEKYQNSRIAEKHTNISKDSLKSDLLKGKQSHESSTCFVSIRKLALNLIWYHLTSINFSWMGHSNCFILVDFLFDSSQGPMIHRITPGFVCNW